jgi:hypothetical protein
MSKEKDKYGIELSVPYANCSICRMKETWGGHGPYKTQVGKWFDICIWCQLCQSDWDICESCLRSGNGQPTNCVNSNRNACKACKDGSHRITAEDKKRQDRYRRQKKNKEIEELGALYNKRKEELLEQQRQEWAQEAGY